MEKKIYHPILILLSLFYISGCAQLKGSGKIWAEHQVTIQDLEKNWEDYTISYAGLSKENAAALMFDPVDDEKKLSGKTWTQVRNKKALSSIIGWIQTYDRYYPTVWKVLGPDNQLFGYVYSPRNDIHMKAIDDRTLYVYDVQSPLYFDDGDDFRTTPEPLGGP